MSRAHHTAAADLSSAGAPQYPRQQVVGNHPFDPLGVPVLQQAELLEKLEQTCLRLGRTPTREELVPALRIEQADSSRAVWNIKDRRHLL